MSFESVSSQKLHELRTMPKRVTNARAKKKAKEGHEETDYLAINADAGRIEDALYRFTIYVRQNLKDQAAFSCGIRWEVAGGESLTLARYNGANHRHDPAVYQCHIHWMREEELRAGKKVPTYVEVTDRYTSAAGALDSLLRDFSVAGLETDPDHPDLFRL